MKGYAEAMQKTVEETYGVKLKYRFGTMVEVVRACMRAENLAEVASFFSFGTNDLTQATFSFSREDAENKFLPMYNERGILQDNPFEVLDVKAKAKEQMPFDPAEGRRDTRGQRLDRAIDHLREAKRIVVQGTKPRKCARSSGAIGSG